MTPLSPLEKKILPAFILLIFASAYLVAHYYHPHDPISPPIHVIDYTKPIKAPSHIAVPDNLQGKG